MKWGRTFNFKSSPKNIEEERESERENGHIFVIYCAHTRNVTKFGFHYSPILFDMTGSDLKEPGGKGLDQ